MEHFINDTIRLGFWFWAGLVFILIGIVAELNKKPKDGGKSKMPFE